MTRSVSLLLLKVVVTAVTIFYGVVPAIADLNDTHLLNPLWSGHARLHAAWFLAFAAGIAGVALYLVCVRSDLVLAIVVGFMFVGGFWIATFFAPFYGGALVDENGYVQRILGIESNMFLFAVVAGVLAICLAATRALDRSA